jgi:hypothetical protein
MDQEFPGKAEYSPGEAAAFARRLGFTRLTEADMPALAAAMATILDAGRNVPRMASKFDQPAPVFRVPADAGK